MNTLQNFRIQYLAPRMNDSTARPVKNLSGYFRHEIVVAAPREQDALQTIVEKGGVVLDLEVMREKSNLERFFSGRISRSYKQKFLQALSFNVQAGLSPEKALEQVILGELGEPRLALNRSLNALQQGYGFVQCLEMLEWFDDSTVAVLRAGEAVGRLSQALDTAVGFYARGTNTIKLMVADLPADAELDLDLDPESAGDAPARTVAAHAPPEKPGTAPPAPRKPAPAQTRRRFSVLRRAVRLFCWSFALYFGIFAASTLVD